MKLKSTFKTILNHWKKLHFSQNQMHCFEKSVEQKTVRYFWIITVFIILFELYNIIYTLHYTQFQLKSVSSRIYMVLYLFMLTFTVLILAFRLWYSKRTTVNPQKILFLYSFYAAVLIFWSVCITLYDQRVSDSLSVYLTVALSMAGLIYMRPAFSIPVYLLSELLLFTQLEHFQQGTMADNYGSYVNSVGFTLVAMFISLYRNYNLKQDFYNQEIISKQNQEILETNRRLSYVASHDALTGLWNRSHLDSWIKDLVSENPYRNIAVFMIDIDFFKQYNDTFGHLMGDHCLCTIAETMNHLLERGLLFRYGGEEFLLALPDPEPDEAKNLADFICHSIENQKIPAASPNTFVTVSIGYSEGIADSLEHFTRLIDQADHALYTAKTSGRNRSSGYS